MTGGSPACRSALLTDHQDRARCVSQAVSADRTPDHDGQRPAPLTPHHQKITGMVGSTDQDRSDLTPTDHETHIHARRSSAESPRERLREHLSGAPPVLVHHRRMKIQPAVEFAAVRKPGPHGHQFCIHTPGVVECAVQHRHILGISGDSNHHAFSPRRFHAVSPSKVIQLSLPADVTPRGSSTTFTNPSRHGHAVLTRR